LYEAFVAVVSAPELPCVAFHIWVIVLPDGCVHDTFHPEIDELPVFFTVTSA
jgi:hypothetical protein